MKAFSSISVQILLAVLIMVVSVLGISSIIDLNLLKHRETRTLEAKGALTADRIANSLAYPLWNLNREETERVVLDEIGSADVSRILVFDESDAVYVGKARGTDGAIKDIDTTMAAVTAPGASLYSFAREVNFKNARIGRVTLVVTDAPLQAELRDLRRGIVIKLILLALLLSVVLFVALRVLVIRPVFTLKSWVENIPSMSSEDVLFPRFKYSGEMNSLAEAFGSMSLNLRRKNEELESRHASLQELNQQLLVEIDERKRAEERIGLLQMITMDVAAASDLTSALEVVLRRVCEKTGWALGQAWIPNLKEDTLDCCPAWYASAHGLDDFRDSTKDVSFQKGQGLPGRVWASGHAVWIRDVTQDTNFPRAEFAKKVGLMAGLGIPIRSGDDVIAVLEFFLREPRDEDERLVEIISAVAAQLGLVIVRKHAEDALRTSEERFSKAFSLAPYRMGIVRIKDGIILDVNENWLRDVGFTRGEIINRPIFELQAWIHDDERGSHIRKILKAGRPFRDREFHINTKNGAERVTLTSGEVIELDGEPCMLWAAKDITERKLAEDALRTSTEQLRALSARLQSAREEEGTRIAREIHDEMGSALTSLKWDLERVDNDLSKSDDGSVITEARNRISSMNGLIESTINTVRRISSELRPGVLDDLGLVAAIDWHAQQFQSRTGITYHPQMTLDMTHLDREGSTAVFRVFQEILTNVLRHAQATSFIVNLREYDGYLELEVKDNGRGITESEKGNTRSLGLLGMRERALLVGGTVKISGTNGKGTTVVVRVPLEA